MTISTHGEMSSIIEFLTYSKYTCTTHKVFQIRANPAGQNLFKVSKITLEQRSPTGKITMKEVFLSIDSGYNPAGKNLFKVRKITLEQRSVNVVLTLFF